MRLALTYGTVVHDAVTQWQANVTTYANENGLTGSLGQVATTYARLDLGKQGQPMVSAGVQGQFDIIVIDTATDGGLGCSLPTLCTIGDTLDRLGISMLVPDEVRNLSILQRRFDTPKVVIVPAIYGGGDEIPMSRASEWNYAMHELGHSFGLGHNNLNPSSRDVMTPGGWTPGVQNCISNLDMMAFAAAYAYVPGPWTPPQSDVTLDPA